MEILMLFNLIVSIKKISVMKIRSLPVPLSRWLLETRFAFRFGPFRPLYTVAVFAKREKSFMLIACFFLIFFGIFFLILNLSLKQRWYLILAVGDSQESRLNRTEEEGFGVRLLRATLTNATHFITSFLSRSSNSIQSQKRKRKRKGKRKRKNLQ